MTKSANEELTPEQRQKLVARRQIQQAEAIFQRARNAGIPEQGMGIKESEFSKMLEEGFFKKKGIDVKVFCHELYTNSDKLLKAPFIIIDGGDMYRRRLAGFALLFRIIAWDKVGKHISCDRATHSLQTWQGSEGQDRTKITEDLKDYDALFISECSMTLFKPALEAGSFFDEILEDREINGKPTILSFIGSLQGSIIEGQQALKTESSEITTGQYMVMLSKTDFPENKNRNNVLRIRVK